MPCQNGTRSSLLGLGIEPGTSRQIIDANHSASGQDDSVLKIYTNTNLAVYGYCDPRTVFSCTLSINYHDILGTLFDRLQAHTGIRRG